MIYFSNNLKFLRSSKGLRQNELAAHLHVKTNTISNYENGISEPDFKTLDEIVKLFDITSSDLLFKDLSSPLVSGNTYKQKDMNSGMVSEPMPEFDKFRPSDTCTHCAEKERVIKAQQITIDELRNDKTYLKEEIRELKKKLSAIRKE